METAYAFDNAGGKSDVVHVNRALENPGRLEEYQILCVPGGFSYGDDLAAGRILGNQIRHHLADAIRGFRAAGKLILGICNGFQVLMKSGILLDESADGNGEEPAVTLTWNDSGKFEDRWVYLKIDGGNSVFLRGIERMYLPIAHAEGKFVARDEAVLRRLAERGRLAVRYAPRDADSDGPLGYPENPNGSQLDTAGLCDETGLVLGMMPHPERHLDPTQHPRWTRGEAGERGDGTAVFENAVGYFA